MRMYTVVLVSGLGKGMLDVAAEDVDLDYAEGGGMFWNFTADDTDSDTVTVAAIPFTNVAYITSEPVK